MKLVDLLFRQSQLLDVGSLADTMGANRTEYALLVVVPGGHKFRRRVVSALDELVQFAHRLVDLLDLIVRNLSPLTLLLCNFPVSLIALNRLFDLFSLFVGNFRVIFGLPR